MVGLYQLRNNKSFIKKDFAICMFFRNISLQMCRQNASSVFFFIQKIYSDKENLNSSLISLLTKIKIYTLHK